MKKQKNNLRNTDTANFATNTATAQTEKNSSPALDANPDTSTTFIFSEHIILPTLLRLACIAFLVLSAVLSFGILNPHLLTANTIIRSSLYFALAGFLLFRAVTAPFQERKCFLCITPEKIRGKIPTGFFGVKEIDIPTADIIAVEKSSLFGIWTVLFFFVSLKFITKDGETDISASSRLMLIKISKTAIDYIKKYK